MDELEEFYTTQEEIPENYRGLYKEVSNTDGSKAWRCCGVKGMFGAKERTTLTEEAKRHRLEAKGHKTALESWSSLGDLETVRAIVEEYPTLKSAVDAGASKSKETVDKLVGERLTAEQTKFNRTLGEKDKTITTLQGRVDRFENAAKVSYVQDAVRSAISSFKGGKFQPGAVEDILMYAERHFEVDADHDPETGELVINGARTRDKVGVTPAVEAAAWLAEMVQRKTHWLEPSEGVGGGPGGRTPGGGGGAGNPWTAEGWNLTKQGAYVQEHGLEKAQQMAKIAGCPWGAMRHPKAQQLQAPVQRTR